MFHVDLTPFYSAFNDLILALIAAAAMYVRKWMATQMQGKLADIADMALTSAANYAFNKLTDEEKLHPKLDTNSPFVAAGVAYAKAHIPDTLAKLGKGDNAIAEMLIARLPQPPAPTK